MTHKSETRFGASGSEAAADELKQGDKTMQIAITYLIPVTVYVDTADRSVRSVCVDDEAPLLNGSLDFVETDKGYKYENEITGASKNRLIKIAENIQDKCEDWPCWSFGY